MKCIACGELDALYGGYFVCSSCLIEKHINEANLLIEQTEKEKKSEEERKLHEFKHALVNSLQLIKGFETAYTSRTNEAIAVEYNGEVFILNIEESPFSLERAVDYL